MKIVIAPDSFKESMTAIEACHAIEKGIHQYDSKIETQLCPLADGGEGTLETLVAAMHGTLKYYEVTGPLFEKRSVPIGYVDNTAIIECAKVCGLELLNEDQKNPYQTTTYGLGELILHAIQQPVHKIMICLGGSATNDGGIGMLSALGVKFLDHHEKSVTLTMKGLRDIHRIDFSSFNQQIKNIEMIGVCDVTNPLCGKQGATYIYGPQKGVLQNDLETIDHSMQNYAYLVDKYLQKEIRHQPGTGAAGGLGYALLSICQGVLKPGFEIVSQTIGLEEAIQSCDRVIVGEGKIDKQTEYGKTPYGVLQIAQKYHKKVYAFAGVVEDKRRLKEIGFQNVYAITPIGMEKAIALQTGKENLKASLYKHMEEIINGL